MTKESHRRQIISYWLSKAEESLESAKRECAAGSFTFAINRIYYAAFYAVSSLLLEKDFSFKKHSGVR
ncbi:MAG: HEPN domain-containing protein [Bacteroidota bacterium]